MTASVLKQDNLLFKCRFEPFICRLSVVLWLDEGDFPEDLHTVCPR